MMLYDFLDRTLRALLVASLFVVPGCPKSKPIDTTGYSSSSRPTEELLSANGERKNSYAEPMDNLLKIAGPAEVERGRRYVFVVDGSTNRTLVFGGRDKSLDIDSAGIKSFRMYGYQADSTSDSYISGFSLLPEIDGRARELEKQARPIFESLTSQDVSFVLKDIGPSWTKSRDTEQVILFTSASPQTGGNVRLSRHARYEIPVVVQNSTELRAFEFDARPLVDGTRKLREAQFTVSAPADTAQETMATNNLNQSSAPQNVVKNTGERNKWGFSPEMTEEEFNRIAKDIKNLDSIPENELPKVIIRTVTSEYIRVSIGNYTSDFDVEQQPQAYVHSRLRVVSGPKREISIQDFLKSERKLIFDNSTREKALLGSIMRYLGSGYFLRFSPSFNDVVYEDIGYRIDRRTISGVEVFDCFQIPIVVAKYSGREGAERESRTVFAVGPSWRPGEEPFYMIFGGGRMGNGTEEFTMDQKPNEFLEDFAAFVAHCDGVRRRGFDRTPFNFDTLKGLHPAVERLLVGGQYERSWRYTLSPEYFSGERASPLWRQE